MENNSQIYQMLNEMSEKIGQLNGSTEKGFEGINHRLDRMNGSLHTHCIKIRALEAWKNLTIGKMSVISAVVAIGVSLFFVILKY